MKRKLWSVISIMILIIAVGAALYPTISAWINNWMAKGEITRYNNTVDSLSAEEKSQLLYQAELYNSRLGRHISDSFSPDAFVDDESYLNTLCLTDSGQMGTIDIPCIDCHLPIYHGSDESMLSKGAIHLAGTALPIGGESSHAILSAHTAYPGQILFDRLTDVKIGDTFSVTVLGETLNYKVIEINTVLPSEISYLDTQEGRDLVTLITCTPYSVNTHRLLVTGERYYPEPDEEQEVPAVSKKESTPVYIALGVLVVIAALIIFTGVRKHKHEK